MTGALTADPGALIKLDMTSQVAVLLDDIPAGADRNAAAAWALGQPASFWQDKALRQVKLTFYRQVFRGGYYKAGGIGKPDKGPLPLPPKSTWQINLTNAPKRQTDPQHDMVVVGYTYGTHILTDVNSPADVESKLGTVGGTWLDDYSLPTDPDLLLERTGYACMDEFEYPPNSVFEENTAYFYDHTCKANSFCHVTQQPTESCVESLQKHTGIVKTGILFTRVAWNKATADSVRVGTVTNPNGANLAVVVSDMEEERRILYKYFAPGSCEMEEGVIGKLGWRRLMLFSATVRNDGTEQVHIGDVFDATNPWVQSNVFDWSACHGHYHFSHYGAFNYNGSPGSKRAFCLEDTNRFHNDEVTPLRATHQSCSYQGITRGWGDEYEYGIPGQWVDITDVDASKPHVLSFDSNNDAFLCEGQLAKDANGVQILDPSEFINAKGQVVSRLRCNFMTNWNGDNHGEVTVSAAPGQTYVTSACQRGQTGPNRNCDFAPTDKLRGCTPGSTVTLSCKSAGASQVLRVCEKSAALNTGVACTLADSKANAVVTSTATAVTFTCPTVRDAAAGTGGYSSYSAPVVAGQASAKITCTGW